MIQDKMVRARRQYHSHHHSANQNSNSGTNGHHHHNSSYSTTNGGGNHRHALNHIYYRHKRPHIPSAPSNTTQFIMNDHETIEPDFDLMHNAIMEHYNRNKKRKHQHVTTTTNTSATCSPVDAASNPASNPMINPAASEENTSTYQSSSSSSSSSSMSSAAAPSLATDHLQQSVETATTTTTTTTTTTPSSCLLPSAAEANSRNQLHEQQQQQQQQYQANQIQIQESIKSNPTTPNYRLNGSPGDEDGMSPFINHEHLHSEFQEVYANIHTERLSSMSKGQLVNQYLLLEERVEELENRLRETQTTIKPTTSCAASALSHG